ncbi:transcription factor adf-1 [Plakobranchus ocellatus]|uniref:Transcription factor adf-1 n=1 Tax=Plakobranchus ocellatus TaxID=259542 RepID=A0AAV4DUX7_9GAST|nr:transcription factor adf-1 [Plakobranchus ocellatus]
MSLNEALIAAVQKRQALYGKTDDNYSNRVFIARQWQEIGKEIGMDDQGARKKWTTIRDYFQKIHRQLTTTRSGSGADKQKKWYLYDSLLFLLPHIGDRATCSNLSPEQQEEESESVRGIESPRDRSHTPSPVPTTVSTSTQNSEAQPLVTPRPRKRKIPQERYTINPVDERMLDAITSIGDKLTQIEAPDEDELFCKSLVSKIRSLDPFSKMECQAEIQMVILKYMRRSTQVADTQAVPHKSVWPDL